MKLSMKPSQYADIQIALSLFALLRVPSDLACVLLSYVCPRFDLFALRSRLCLLSYDDEDVYYPKGRRPREDEEGEESYEKQRQRPGRGG